MALHSLGADGVEGAPQDFGLSLLLFTQHSRVTRSELWWIHGFLSVYLEPVLPGVWTIRHLSQHGPAYCFTVPHNKDDFNSLVLIPGSAEPTN